MEYDAHAVSIKMLDELTPQQPSSANMLVLQRGFHEFYPNSQVNYSFNSNDRIQIDLYDQHRFLDAKSSYLKFNLTCKVKENVDDDAKDYPDKSLDVGGAHALFKRVTIKSHSGTVLDDCDQYGMYSAIESYLTDDAEYVEHVGQSWGDSVSGGDYVVPYAPEAKVLLVQTVTGAANALTLSAAVGYVIVPGDRFEVSGVTYTATAVVAADATSIPVTPNPAVADPAVAAGTPLYRLIAPISSTPSTRKVAASTVNYLITMKLKSGLFKQDKYLPLMLMKKLQLELHLQRPQLAFNSGRVLDANDFMDFSISNIRFVASLCELDRSIIDEYAQMFNSGISYSFQSVAHYASSLSNNTDFNLIINNQMRNAKSVVSVIVDSEFTNLTTAQSSDSISSFQKKDLIEWQYKAGSVSYPLTGPVRTDALDPTMSETFTHARDALRAQEFHGYVCRISPPQWRSGKVILGARLERSDQADQYAGLDLTDNNLSLITKHSAPVGTTSQINHFIIHSRTLILSKDGVVVKY